MSVDHLWAGWRTEYVQSGEKPDCVFCALFASDLPPVETNIVWRDENIGVVLNAYPYVSGHLLVMPVRHVGELEDLTAEEHTELFASVTKAVKAIKSAYGAPGLNVGLNLGAAAGAGIPQHLHAHVLPRFNGDTNFMTSVANTRVLPEALSTTWTKLSSAWL